MPDRVGGAATIFKAIAEAGINIDMIVQNVSAVATGRTDISFTLPPDDGQSAMTTLQRLQEAMGFESLLYDDRIGKVSLIGAGMRSHPGVTAKLFGALADAGVNIEMISTSEIRISEVEGGPPALIGADWNTQCADRIRAGAWRLYESADPYASVAWFADLIYQCQSWPPPISGLCLLSGPAGRRSVMATGLRRGGPEVVPPARNHAYTISPLKHDWGCYCAPCVTRRGPAHDLRGRLAPLRQLQCPFSTNRERGRCNHGFSPPASRITRSFHSGQLCWCC